MKNELQQILGAGGGGGGGHTPVESPNSLVSKTTARVLFLTSDGEIGGLADQTNPLKSVFFNNVPVMNSDGTFNFANVQMDERYGLPSQTVMAGFPSASSSYSVATKVTTTTPVTYTSSTSAADAIRITIRFPAMFAQQSNGDTTGTTVSFQIYKRLGAGSFTLEKTIDKSGKCTSPTDADYLIDRPSGAGTWSVKVVRITADNSSTTLGNDIYFQTATELQYASLPYNNRAYVGMSVTAETTGSNFPLVAFDLNGIKVKVPSNYNPTTRVYTGSWDGLFSGTKQVTDNPAWVLYDLLTNTTHGMGLAAADIDQYSFYDAAVYNDGLVPTASGVGTEPRYTFNYQLMEQQSAWSTIQNIAASFGSIIYTSGNRVKLVQDRPTSWSRLITNSNVVDGLFEYTSSQLTSRTSACIVYWNNPNENWLSVPCYYEDTAGTARYGLTVKEVTGLGITTEGQALRLAKWHVDTSLNNTDAVVFKVGFANAGLEPGDVFKLMDTDYAQVMNEAKIVSATSSSITVDRPITVAAGNTFDVVRSDGDSVDTRTITSTGTLTTINYSGASIAVVAGADVIFSTAVSPRYFKVTDVKEDSVGIYTVSAVEYDSNKFGRVDSTPTGLTAVYQAPTQIPSAPIGLAFREASINDNGTVRRTLTVSWSRPTAGVVKSYIVNIRRNNTNWDQFEVQSNAYDVSPAADGTYDVQVYAKGYNDVQSAPVTGSYTISLTGGGSSTLNAPTTLVEQTSGGTTFTGPDLNFKWTNPTSNGTVSTTLRDFEVRIVETAGSTTVRTFYVDAVAPGAIQLASYTYAMNLADGGPRRSLQVQVRCRDTNNNLSNPVSATFTNSAPAAIGGIAVTGGLGSNKITFNLPTDPDFKGIIIWRSTTNGFTPASGNVIYDGSDNYVADNAITTGTTYYYKLAAYDSFSKDYAGSGLNVSAQYSAAPVGVVGADITAGSIDLTKFASGLTPVEVVGSLPGSGNFEGRQALLTTDGKLYRYHSGAWTKAVDGGDIVANTITSGSIAAGAINTTQLAANAVTANNLAVIPTNICPDPAFSDEAYWSQFISPNGWFFEVNTPFGASRKMLSLWSGHPTNIPGTAVKLQYSQPKPFANGGQVLRFRARFNNASNQNIIAGAEFCGPGPYDYISGLGVTSTAGSGVQVISGQGTVPDNTAYVRFVVYNAGGSTYTGGASVTDISLDLASGADLIVDGAVSASKIAANTIVAGNIAANTITGDKIATNTVTATNIDTRNLTIKDGSGTVVFSAGVPLASAYLAAGTGGNLLPNSDAASGYTSPWAVTWVQDAGTNYAFGIDLGGTSWTPQGGHVLSLTRWGNARTGAIDFRTNKIPVLSSGRYEYTAYVASHRSDLWLNVVWADSSGAYISEVAQAATRVSGGTKLSDFTRVGFFVTAPSNAAAAIVGIRVGATDSGQTDSYAFATNLFFGQATGAQTEFSPWSPSSVNNVSQLGYTGALNATYGATFGSNISGQITAANASTYIASAAIGSAQIDYLATSNYAESGGNPTAGAKLSSAGTAFKVASGSMQVGGVYLTDYWFRLLNAIDGAYGTNLVWRGNNDITTRGGAPNIDCLDIYTVGAMKDAGNFTILPFTYSIQPTALNDNLDSLRYFHLDVYEDGGGSTVYGSLDVQVADRLYANATHSNSANASKGHFTLNFRPSIDSTGNFYVNSSPYVFSGHMLVTLYNAYGASAQRWYHGYPSISNAAGTALLRDSTAPGGGPSAGSGGGAGGSGGYCPAPWVQVTLEGGRKIPASDLFDGARVIAVKDTDLAEVQGGGTIRYPQVVWKQRIELTLRDGRKTEWSRNHRFYVVNKGWVEIQNLVNGDLIAGPIENIVAGVKSMGEGPVVSFQVEGAGTYFGDDMLCHNLKYDIP